MAEPVRIIRIPTLKTVAGFRSHIASLGIDLPCEDQIVAGSASPLAEPGMGKRDTCSDRALQPACRSGSFQVRDRDRAAHQPGGQLLRI